MNAVIEVAGAEDAESLAALHYLSHTVSFAPFASAEWVASRDLSTYQKQWRDFFTGEARDRSRAWKAVLGGEVVGMVKVSPMSAGEAQLASMHVHPEFHRRGIGSLLMDAAMDFIRTSGFELASLGVIQANAPARSVYERFGWTVRELHDDGIEGVPIAVYELRLPTRA